MEGYESFYDVIQSPRGKTSISSCLDDDEEGSSSGGGIYPETPDQDFRWDHPLIYPRKKSQHRRTEGDIAEPDRNKKKNPPDSDDDDDEGELDSSYEEIRLNPSPPPKSTITPPFSTSFEVSFPRQSDYSTTCDSMISLHEETAPRHPPLSSANLWASIDDVPKDISSLSVEQVSACLNVLNLGHYVRSFREHQIDGALLACLDREVLVGDFRFRSFEAIKLVKFARDGWRPRIKQNETNA